MDCNGSPSLSPIELSPPVTNVGSADWFTRQVAELDLGVKGRLGRRHAVHTQMIRARSWPVLFRLPEPARNNPGKILH